MHLSLLACNAALVFTLMTVLWLVSIRLRDVSIVDPWWSISFLLVTMHTIARTGLTPAKALLVILVAAWSLRLWVHLLLRSRGKPEDVRYASFRRFYGPDRYWWVSYFQVFLLQGCLSLLISSPLQLASAASPLGESLKINHLAGLLLFTVGFACETVADWQLQTFRNDPAQSGKVLDTGLWRWSRHPNYFGEAVVAWGLWLFALGQPFAGVTALAPALMTFLLLRVSGVNLLDAHLKKTRLGYADYVRRTSAFVPLPPRPQGQVGNDTLNVILKVDEHL